MNKSIDTNMLGIYLLHNVRVTFTSGEYQDGVLSSLDSPDTLELNSETYSLSMIDDVEFVGNVTDYHAYSEIGEIQNFTFTQDDLLDERDIELIKYGDFDCAIACHLVIEDGRIKPKDIHVISWKHRIFPDELAKKTFWYRLSDHSILCGKLAVTNNTNILHLQNGNTIDLDLQDVVDITKAPEVNEYLIIGKTDHTVIQGIVSAVTDSSLVLLKDGSPIVLKVSDINSLRYVGNAHVNMVRNNSNNEITRQVLFSTSDINKRTYLCKQIGFRDYNTFNLISNNDKVSFVIFVNDRGVMAKDAELEEPSDTTLVSGEEELDIKKGIVISSYNTISRKQFGQISSEYYSTTDQLQNELDSDKKQVLFSMDKLSFNIRRNCLYIVNYSSTIDPETGQEYVVKMELESIIHPLNEYDRVLIQNGDIIKVKVFENYLGQHLNDYVEITTVDKEIENGIIKEYDGKEIVLIPEGESGERTIQKDNVDKVRFLGEITFYDNNRGSGYIDQIFWFHISQLRDRVDAVNLGYNRRVLFSVLRTNKGNGLQAGDISILNERQQKGLLTGTDGEICFIKDLDSRVIHEYRIAENRHGIVDRIVDLKFNEFEYPIRYIFRMRGLETQVVVLSVDTNRRVQKPLSGYLLKYVNKQDGRSFGFIIVPNALHKHLKENDRTGTIYFKNSDIINREALPIDTSAHYYRVEYTLKEPQVAGNVRILEKFNFTAERRRAIGEAELPFDYGSQTVSLAKFSETLPVYYSGITPQIGFITSSGTSFARINNSYYNKNHFGDNLPITEQSTVQFDPKQSKIIGTTRFQASKYCYLVRYVADRDTIDPVTGLATINYNYPIEVLQRFIKKNCTKIEIQNEQVVIGKANDLELSPIPVATEIPDIQTGETVIFQLKDSGNSLVTYQAEEDDYYVVNDDIRIPSDSVERIYRFGVVTAFEKEKGTLILNNILEVQLSCVNPKIVSILGNQTKIVPLYLIYEYTGDYIVAVNRFIDDEGKQIDALIPWEKGVVTAIDDELETIIINNNAIHRVSGSTNPIVSHLFKTNMLLNEEVYVKTIKHIFFNKAENQTELVVSPYDIRMKYESAVIKYDEGRNLFMGYRNAASYFSMSGTKELLMQFADKEARVVFELSEDGNTFIAKLDVDEESDEEAEETAEEMDNYSIKNILEDKLTQFCLNQTDLSKIQLRGIVLNNDTIADELEIQQKAFDSLCARNSDTCYFAAAKLALNSDVNVAQERSGNDTFDRDKQIAKLIISAMQRRYRIIGKSADFVSGEYSYYLSLLLRYSVRRKRGTRNTRSDYLYSLFAQDFVSREELDVYLQSGFGANQSQLNSLFVRPCKNISEFYSHLLQLDHRNLELICSIINSNEELRDNVIQHIHFIEETVISSDLNEAVQQLNEYFANDRKRFARSFYSCLENNNIIEDTKNLIQKMSARFLKLIGNDDASRFEKLKQICAAADSYENYPGFPQQEDILKNAYRDVCDLEKDIMMHPCRESTEMLIMRHLENSDSSVITKVKEAISDLLDSLYKDESTLPQIKCSPNRNSIAIGQDYFWMNVANGSVNQKLQAAENVVIHLESFPTGIVPAEISIKQSRLNAGEVESIKVPLVFEYDLLDNHQIDIAWYVSFDYATSFEDGKTNKTRVSIDLNNMFGLQIGKDEKVNKSQIDSQLDNPYFKPSEGEPLQNNKMFYGRTDEKKEILNSIVVETQTLEPSVKLRNGSAIIIHGQKKSGKTSLVNQIKNEIRQRPDINTNAIIIDFNNILDNTGGVEALHSFKRNFYSGILRRFETELTWHHKELGKLLEDKGVFIPDLAKLEYNEVWPSVFEQFVMDFKRVDNNRHTILLFMDEFTLLCTEIIKKIYQSAENESLATIPTFIKTFSDFGFIQVIIGHDAMMRAFDTLKVLNHTAEFAKSIEIGALDEEASKQLIIEPMKSVFGFNPYDSVMGERAVNRLLDLSGRHPTYLMRLCSRMFIYYVSEQCDHAWITDEDVELVLSKFIDTLLLKDFDILAVEDGDDTSDPEKRSTYIYLKTAAFAAAKSNDRRTADVNQVGRLLLEKYNWNEFDLERTKNLLETRRVISITSGGRVKINVALFLEYEIRKHGGLYE